MICNVYKSSGITRGHITAGPASDLYIFDLDYMHARWEYMGKLVGESFISGDAQGYEHIPQEFWAALDVAWRDPNGHYEFPDPLHDDLGMVV